MPTGSSVHPPNDFPAYGSTALRAPKQPLRLLEGRLAVLGGIRFDIHLQGERETVFFDR